MPDTPLTRPNLMPVKQNFSTPLVMATQSVDQLRSHVGECNSEMPKTLCDLLKQFAENPVLKIKQILSNMSTQFCAKFETNAMERFKLAEAVYYRFLENILRHEMAEKKENFDKVISIVFLFN